MSLPPPPRVSPPPLVPSAESRRCSSCSSPLSTLGIKALDTAAGNGQPAGHLVLETFWCPHCGKVEFFTPRAAR